MANCYIATAQRGTAVGYCLTGFLVNPGELNLLVAKNDVLELYSLGPEGLRLLYELPIYGRICCAKLIKSPVHNGKDWIFLVTGKYSAIIIEFELSGSDKFEVVTKACGNVSERVGRVREDGILCTVDPNGRFIGLQIYDGYFKLLVIDKDSKELKSFNMRLDELHTHSIEFLHGRKAPTIAVLHSDRSNARHIKTHVISVKDREFLGGPWQQENVDSLANIIIPVTEPYGGAIVIGSESLFYVTGEVQDHNHPCVAPAVMRGTVINCYCQVDATRYLLGDSLGRLFMLFLNTYSRDNSVTDLKVELLGLTNIAESLTYLDNGVVYVGSRFGDSQLIRLTADADASGSYLQVIDTYTNIGPIVDMCLMDADKQGQMQLVTCSGAFSNGSLRIIRSGVGIHEHASIELAGTKAAWAASWKASIEGVNNMVVLTFIGQTRFLLLSDESDPEEVEVPGLTSSEQTIYCGNVCHSQIVQVTGSGIRLLNPNGGVASWGPPDGRIISVCSTAGAEQVVCASGQHLYYVEIGDSTLNLVSTGHIEYEVACIDLGFKDAATNRSSYCVVGLWKEISVRILSLPTFSLIYTELLGTEIIPRSVLLVNFDGINYLFVSCGDGTLFYFRFQPSESPPMADRKRLILGTQPMMLRAFSYQGVQNIFAISDRSTVIYSRNQKIVLSSVNMKNVVSVCSLNSAAYPDSLVLATSSTITFGSIHDIQRLHVQTVPLREAPRRLAYDESTNTIAVLSTRTEFPGVSLPLPPPASTMAPTQSGFAKISLTSDVAGPSTSTCDGAAAASSDAGGEEEAEIERHSLLIFDALTFDILHARHLAPNEYACSIASVRFEAESSTPFYVLGIANMAPTDMESKSGRLVVFQWIHSTLVVVTEKEIKGAPYQLREFNGRLLATINSAVMLFVLTPNRELQQDCAYYNCIQALYAKCMGDSILVGDLMHSQILLAYRPVEGQLEEVARDIRPAWMTAVEFIDEDRYIGGENGCNIFVCQKASATTAGQPGGDVSAGAIDEDKKPLFPSGSIHIADFVNVFQRGWLGIQHVVDAMSMKIQTPILFGTVTGAIGLIVPLPIDEFDLLKRLETKMEGTIKSVGRIPHEDYRAFQNERTTAPSSGFVDGDLLELFLDLPVDKQTEVCSGVLIDDNSGMKRNCTVEEVTKRMEELSHLH